MLQQIGKLIVFAGLAMTVFGGLLYLLGRLGLRRLPERFERNRRACRWRGGFLHQAETWKRSRRILYKVEVKNQGTNRRFVITNCKGVPHDLWPVYDDGEFR